MLKLPWSRRKSVASDRSAVADAASEGDLVYSLAIVEEGVIRGYVVDLNRPHEGVTIEITVDGVEVARLRLGEMVNRRRIAMDWDALSREQRETFLKRPLVPAGLRFSLPDVVERGKTHVVGVSCRGRVLMERESTLIEGMTETLRGVYGDFVQIALERLGFEGSLLRVSGWISPPESLPEDATFTINGVPFDGVLLAAEGANPVVRDPGLAELERWRSQSDPPPRFERDFFFSFWPGRPLIEFTAQVDLSKVDPTSRGYRIDVTRGPGGAPYLPPGQAICLPADAEERLGTWPMPSESSVARNTGNVNRYNHRFSGFTNRCHFEDFLMAAGGPAFDKMGRILDWGCGCGRLTQHLAMLDGPEVHGADIDAANVAWASEAYLRATFTRIDPQPPMPYDDATFDLAIGISVFTHLAEDDQFRWLEELRRVIAPGGYALMTVAGYLALKRAKLQQVVMFYREMRERGFSDSNIGDRLNEVLGPHSLYYRNTRHTPEYVHRAWSRYFEVLEIVPGGNTGQQDLVVMRRP